DSPAEPTGDDHAHPEFAAGQVRELLVALLIGLPQKQSVADDPAVLERPAADARRDRLPAELGEEGERRYVDLPAARDGRGSRLRSLGVGGRGKKLALEAVGALS